MAVAVHISAERVCVRAIAECLWVCDKPCVPAFACGATAHFPRARAHAHRVFRLNCYVYACSHFYVRGVASNVYNKYVGGGGGFCG